MAPIDDCARVMSICHKFFSGTISGCGVVENVDTGRCQYNIFHKYFVHLCAVWVFFLYAIKSGGFEIMYTIVYGYAYIWICSYDNNKCFTTATRTIHAFILIWINWVSFFMCPLQENFLLCLLHARKKVPQRIVYLLNVHNKKKCISNIDTTTWRIYKIIFLFIEEDDEIIIIKYENVADKVSRAFDAIHTFKIN